MSKKLHMRGFSLIEICIVLALLTVIALLIGSQARFFDRLIARSELERLHTTCIYLQRLAMATHTEQNLIFDEARTSYRYRDVDYHLPHSVIFGCAKGVKGPPASPTNVIAHPITFKNKTITFYPDGIIQAGTIYLADRDTRYMYALSCGVSQVSYVRKYQYAQSKWMLI